MAQLNHKNVFRKGSDKKQNLKTKLEHSAVQPEKTGFNNQENRWGERMCVFLVQ